MYQNFDDEKKEKASRNPFNRHILKGGQVDPGSKMYQRSVAGREKLDTMLQRLWSDGMDEADVFMAGVKALTSRDKGYVGAYLDSKNPGRIYQKNEAMAITDQVMSDAGIGSHPGNRLTREKDEEGKAKRKEENISRGGFGPKQAPGAKAMSVRQQRKQGKRPSTGQPVEETDREGIADRETGPRSEWQKTLRDRMEGKATTADVLEGFQKQYQSRLSQSPQAQAKRDQKTKERQQKMRDQIAEQKGLEDQEAAAGPEPEEEFKPTIEGVGIRNAFKEYYKKALERTGSDLKSHVKRVATKEAFSTDLSDIINDIEQKGFKVDPNEFKKAIAQSFGINLDNYPGWDSEIGSGAAQEPASPEAPAPSTAPTETAAAPEPAEGAAPEPEASAPATATPGGGKLPAKEINDDFLDAFADYLFDPDSGRATKKNVNGYIRDAAKNYGVGTQEIIKAIRSSENGARALKNSGFGNTSLIRKGDTSTPEPEPAEGAAPEPEAPAPKPTPEGDGEKPAAPAPEPEDAAPEPAEGATPEPETPAAGTSKEKVPTSRTVTSKGGFKALLQQGRKKGGGGGFGGARAAAQKAPEVMKAGKEAPSLEDFKTYLYNTQGELFGKKGFDTGGSGNPMEDQAPDPYAKYRGEPAEPRPGAQEGGREPATAGKGEEGQGSLLKKGTTEARGDFKRGQKPKPQRKKRQRPTSENPPPPAKRPSTQNERASRFKELMDSGMSAQKALSIMKQEGSVNTRSAKRSRKRGVSNSAEYQEFAQSIRSMMR